MNLYKLFFPLFLSTLQVHAIVSATGILTNASTIATIGCKKYMVHDGETCFSITRANNITYAQMLAWNSDLKPTCTNIKDFLNKNICISNPSGKFTIPNNSRGATATISTQAPKPAPVLNTTNEKCGQFYKVAKGDDCSTIEAEFGISLKDFIFLNPEVGTNCTHLLLDYYYCVRPVGAISTYIGYGGAQTNNTTWVELSMKSVPRRDIMASFRTDKPMIPMANGTRRDCILYFWLEDDNTDCLGWSYQAETSLEEFMLWNPSLREDKKKIHSSGSNNPQPCTLSASSSYCLLLTSPSPSPVSEETPPSPRAVGEIANCTDWFHIGPETTFDTMMGLNNLTMKDFCSMNPSVGINCEGLAEGTYYCVSTHPGGNQPYNEDDDRGDDDHHTTMASPTMTKNGLISTPSPVQTGISSTCRSFYRVAKDDACDKIAQDHNITLSDFYTWNPAVSRHYSSLQAGVYVCVGVL
ncbi:hypothetical protein ACSS6W_008610 [Trichoderma asperelloides]